MLNLVSYTKLLSHKIIILHLTNNQSKRKSFISF